MESPLCSSHPLWVTERIVAKITGLSVHTLRAHRFKRCGLPYVKIEHAVRYSLDDIIAFMQARTIRPQA